MVTLKALLVAAAMYYVSLALNWAGEVWLWQPY